MARKVSKKGYNFILGALRALARDPAASSRVRLEAIDRLAIIDELYNVDIAPPSSERNSEPPDKKNMEQLLTEWKKQMSGGDSAKAVQSTGAASNEAGR